ncbi:DUF742 domain-containing protein [Streptomyces sp. NPDC002306]
MVSTPTGGDRYGTPQQHASYEQSNFLSPSGRTPHVPAKWVTRPQQSGLVRPYAMTGGRTRPSYQLAIEALVSTSANLAQMQDQSPESYRIGLLCREVKSVAEISALLAIPLGVTRILVADLAQAGLVVVHQAHSDDAAGGRPHVTLLEKVLVGLRNL